MIKGCDKLHTILLTHLVITVTVRDACKKRKKVFHGPVFKRYALIRLKRLFAAAIQIHSAYLHCDKDVPKMINTTDPVHQLVLASMISELSLCSSRIDS